MNDQKNMLLAIALTFVVLLGFDYLVMRPQREAAMEKTPAAGSPLETPAATTALIEDVVPRETALAASPRVFIETPRLKGSIALRGGLIDDLTLIGYRQTVEPDSPPVVLLNPKGAENAYYAAFGWLARAEFGLETPGEGTIWETGDRLLTPGNPVTLSWQGPKGLSFERRIAVDENYLFTITDTVRNAGETPVLLAPYGLINRRGEPAVKGFAVMHEGPLGVFENGLEEKTYKDIRKNGTFSAKSVGGWLGMTDKYWLTALVPEQEVPFNARFTRKPEGAGAYQVDYREEEIVVPAGGEKSVTSRLFAGAKEVDVIERYETTENIRLFDRAIDWGWFIFLTKPIFYLLDLLYGVTGSFAIAILLLTVIVKLVFLPLANKSYVSMSHLKAVQPKMKALQERYKDDRARLQQEMMELYKKEKINPLAGCLPMLVQIPVFFALYKVLFVTIEMRHQPGLFWIDDLSAADPLLVTNLFGLLPFTPPGFLAIGLWPVIMGVTQFLQMRLNPSAGDPMQQRILSAMPFVFIFIMASFPAGLVMYWTWNTILSGLQQWIIMKRHGAFAPSKS